MDDLRTAIADRSFHMEYQPIVDLHTRQVHAIEALARWEHPDLGRIRPDIFIELAEEFNVISDLSAVLFEITCRDLAWFRYNNIHSDNFQVNFNVSARELREIGFAEKMLNAAKFHDVPIECFTFELTESALIENVSRAKKELGILKQHGASIALDDFGKGYSSLSYLTRLPVDVVKVDKIFVQGLIESDDNASVELINAIVGLQDSMGIKVVGEGIETTQQHKILKRMKCAYGQGYLLGKPATREKTSELLSSGLELKTLRVVS